MDIFLIQVNKKMKSQSLKQKTKTKLKNLVSPGNLINLRVLIETFEISL